MITVVCPVYNEAGSLRELTSRIRATLDGAGVEFELLLVNDGSTDESLRIIRDMVKADGRVKGISLSRNFGQQAAITAGLDVARGDAVILMDADLQDSPEALPKFVEKWKEGFEVVDAVRTGRKEGPALRLAFKMFYLVQTRLVDSHIPRDSGLFCLMDRRVVDLLKEMPEHNRYLPGMRAWVGFRQAGMPVERGRRYDDRNRVGLKGLVKLALDGIFSFSVVPLRIATMFSLAAGGVSVFVIMFVIFHKFITGRAIPGWASTLGSTTLLGALILFSLGLIGEYLARIYDEVKKRPLYIVREIIENGSRSQRPPAGE